MYHDRNNTQEVAPNPVIPPAAYGQQPQAYGQQPQAYGQQPQVYGQQPQAYGQQPQAYGQHSGSLLGYGEPQANLFAANACRQPDTREPETFVVVGPKSSSKPYDDADSFSDAFSNAAIRRGFIKKVYLILTTQLLFTFGLVALFIFVKPVKEWAQTRVGMYFYIVSYALFIVLYIVLICASKVRRKTPGNYICLGLFTLCFSYMTAMISSYHDTTIVLMAMGITALVCVSISLFAMQTKIDFTMCHGFLFVFCIVVFFFGWSCMITYYTWGGSYILNTVYGALIALLFGLFLVYDTQQVVGGHKYELSPEEYIYGALQLYIDIVYLFLIILSFFKN